MLNRKGGARSVRLTLAVLASVAAGAAVTTGEASAATKTSDLTGVSITFGDQLKEYQTIVNATDTLQGAAYTVNWSNFIGGPPIIAAEVGGSVDVGDMAETPTIFSQAAGDAVKVIGVTEGVGTNSPFAVMVPNNSPIQSASQLRGKTIAVQEGTVEQYVLVKVLQAAGIPYNDVTIDNLSIVAGETALTSGKVDAWVSAEPLSGLVEYNKQGKVLPTAANSAKLFGYLTAPVSALDDPKKKAAIVDFVTRLEKSQAILKKDPALAAKTYASTYGVPLAVAEQAVKSANVVPTPVTPSIIAYQQEEANTFYKLGLIPDKIHVASVFDSAVNNEILAAVTK